MSGFNGLWQPMADASNASPGEYDMHKVVNSQLVQAARVGKTFIGRLMANNTPMHMGGGVVNRDVEFTVLGGIGTETHLRNDRFKGMDVQAIQRSVTLDKRPRTTTLEWERITQMFEQVDTRQRLFDRMGNALAKWDEVEAMKAIVDAAKFSSGGSENQTEFLPGGGEIELSTATAGAAKALEILDALEDIAIKWDEQEVPTEGRHVILPIQDVVEIIKLEKAYTGATAIAGGIYGNLDIASGATIPFTQFPGSSAAPIVYRGFNIWSHVLFKAAYDIHTAGLQGVHTIDTNHSSRGSSYNSGDLTKIQGLVFQQEAVGKADVMSVMFDQGQVPMSTNDYANAMTWVGYGTLRPEAAVVLDIA